MTSSSRRNTDLSPPPTGDIQQVYPDLARWLHLLYLRAGGSSTASLDDVGDLLANSTPDSGSAELLARMRRVEDSNSEATEQADSAIFALKLRELSERLDVVQISAEEIQHAARAVNATNTTITDDITTNATMYLTWVTAATGNLPQKVSSTKLAFNPFTGLLTATGFSGPLTGNVTGDVTGNAATVTTNANLTGPITSAGNATSVASQTGTGSKFVMDTNPTLISPVLGAATASSLVVTASLSADGSISKNATAGLKFQAVAGTSYDAALLTVGSTAYVWRVITGTARINFTDATDSTSSITGGGTFTGGLGVAKRINGGSTIRTGVYTVAALPAGTLGDRAMVSDASAPTFGAAVVGGGAVAVPVYYAAAWMVG